MMMIQLRHVESIIQSVGISEAHLATILLGMVEIIFENTRPRIVNRKEFMEQVGIISKALGTDPKIVEIIMSSVLMDLFEQMTKVSHLHPEDRLTPTA